MCISQQGQVWCEFAVSLSRRDQLYENDWNEHSLHLINKLLNEFVHEFVYEFWSSTRWTFEELIEDILTSISCS
jgi:hypothetical protein